MILYHQTSVKFVDSILSEGLIPQKPDAWKGLLDGIVRNGKLIVWFTDNIRPRGSYLHSSKCLVQVDTKLVDTEKLKKLKVSGWWVYEDRVPAEAIKLVSWELYRIHKPKFWGIMVLGVMDKVTKGTEPFYENLEMAIENLLNDESSEETFDWEIEGVLGFRCWKDNGIIKVEIKSG